MKKWICVLLLLALCAIPPGGGLTAEETAAEQPIIDFDLTKMNGSMVYAQVFQMMYEPEGYIGKIVRMAGWFDAYQDPDTGIVYTCCFIPDASACCSQGLEFVWAGEHPYPEAYPARGAFLTVTGRFETYLEDGWEYVHLTDAAVEWEAAEQTE